MKKYVSKDKGFTTILFTIMIMFLVSIVVFSLFFLCVYEYHSICNYSYYEQAYYLALGAQEEAISRLSSNWNITADTSWMPLGTGNYQYKITTLTPNRKKIISQGKVATMSRKFECIVQVPLETTDFHKFTNYSIYCNGDLRIYDFGKIDHMDNQGPGIIGVTGSLWANSITGGSSPMDVIGNISLNQTNKNTYLKMYPLIDSNLPICGISTGISYTTWLQDQYSERVHYIELQNNENFILDERSNPTEKGKWDICIVKGGQSLYVEDLHFDGLLIVEDIKEIQIAQTATIEGMFMVFGGKTNSINIHGNVIGNICLLDLSHVANFSGKLVYDQKPLAHITSFLSYNHVNNSTIYDLIMIKWNEVE